MHHRCMDNVCHKPHVNQIQIGTMAKTSVQQLPLRFRTGHKTDIRAQFAALCWRMKNDKVQICLITSRTRQRWIIPKGWPMHKQTPAAAAAAEAFEEAGGPFDPKMAKALEDNILSAGGSREADVLYTAFRGRMPGVEALLKGRGLDQVA